jgi:hypothetical protein
VEYLQEAGFEGNLMTPFTAGAYVSWKLYPHVLVSMDGRYEVAYPPGALRETLDAYAARDGWRETLARHPTQLVLAPAGGPLATALVDEPGWRRVYVDDAFEVHARDAVAEAQGLSVSDRRGERFTGELP